MGKRKRGLDHVKHPTPCDSTQHVRLEDLHSEQRSSGPAETNAATQSPPVIEVVNGSMERPALQKSPDHSHFSGQPKLSKHSHYPFGRLYSRRGSSAPSDASPSYWKGSAAYDAKLSFKLGNKDLLDFNCRGIKDRTFIKPDRIRSRSFLQNTVWGETRKMECRLCQKRLKKSPFISESSLSASNDHRLSVVAVLVCGHAYHADCLEQKTSLEHKHDPLCPLCLGQTSSSS